ncbi:MAG: LytTR family transcriptional regulator [Alphaproteobacteria bacterium]|nr:LytTR family transcriptional regulator [Alphaproteobacteria bacterium]
MFARSDWNPSRNADTTVHEARNAGGSADMTGRLRQFLRPAAIIVGLAALFTWFGVYDFSSHPVLRFVMWLVTMSVGGVSAIWIIPAVFERRFAQQNVIEQVALAAALIALPVTGSLVAFFLLLGGRVSPGELPMQYLYVYAVCVVMVTSGIIVSQAQTAKPLLETAEAQDVIARFMQRLPVKYRTAELWAVSSEDHYLRVHTDRGEELILMRLADAMRDLGGTDGLQTHRSWWVAKAGVADTRREGGRLFLVLKCGKAAPVSRTYASAVKLAGLI